MKDSQRVLALALLMLGFAAPSFSQLQSAKTFVYVNNLTGTIFGPNSVSAYSVVSDKNQSDYGSLKELTALGSPFLTGGLGGGGGVSQTNHIAIAGTFLYATNDASNDISAFSINPASGELKRVTDINGNVLPPFPSGLTGFFSGIDLASATTPDGQLFLYAAGIQSCFFGPPCNAIVASFRIEGNGALTAIPAPSLPPSNLINLRASPDGRFLAVETGGVVTLFSIGSGGVLSNPRTVFFPGSSYLEFNCGSNLLFASLFTGVGQPGMVAVYEVTSDGNLSPVSNSPFSFNNDSINTGEILLSPNDLNLLVANNANGLSGSIASLNVTPGGGGSVTQTNPLGSFLVSFSGVPGRIATNQQGTLVYVSVVGNLATTILGFSMADNGALTQILSAAPPPPPGSFGLRSLAVFPPKTCFGNLAARQAQTDAGGQYGLGGKGFDFSTPSVDGSNYSGNQCEFQLPNSANPSTAPCYIKPAEINNRYKYADSNVPHNGELFFDFGMDCSGLVLWSYNTAVNATNVAQAPGSPAQGTDAKLLPIWWEGVGAPWQTPPTDGQCTDAQSIFLINNLGDPAQAASYTAPLDLRPGDLLCFKYHQSDGSTNPHVALYLGNQSTQTGVGGSSLDSVEDYTRTYGVKFDHVDSRGSSNLSRVFQDVSLTKNCLIQSTRMSEF